MANTHYRGLKQNKFNPIFQGTSAEDREKNRKIEADRQFKKLSHPNCTPKQKAKAERALNKLGYVVNYNNEDQNENHD